MTNNDTTTIDIRSTTVTTTGVDRIPVACPDAGMRVLIANRGEIARRVIRACTSWEIESVAVYADPDADAPHVREATHAERIGPASLADSYLSIPAILAAAERSAATHVHPGYGFLAENTEFATAVTDAGLIWCGPSPAAVASMGSKIEARTVAVDAGVPVIPGYNESQADGDLRAAADDIGYPILVKASAGGGGKGIRIAHSPDDFDDALRDARDESARAFGDDAVIVERYIQRPRHIEVQIVADHDGSVIDLGTRECSVQRRYQKVLEEAPAPNLPAETETAMRSAAVSLASAIGYDSVGTVEFIVDATTEEFFFLEMNTRIQVEHTVTEEITGVDLIQTQIAMASGAPLPTPADTFDAARAAGVHSFEARINAEDPWRGHLPQTGDVDQLEVSTEPSVRWDAAVEAGNAVSPHYDSMIGKLIVGGVDRSSALAALGDALEALTISPLTNNLDFHRWLIRRPEVRQATVTTRFLDETPLPTATPVLGEAAGNPWRTTAARRLTPHVSELAFDSPTRDGRWASDRSTGDAGLEIRSPFPGQVAEIRIAVGDAVDESTVLCTIEAMKMLHPITAAGAATVAEILVEAGDQVVSEQPLIRFTPPANQTETPEEAPQ